MSRLVPAVLLSSLCFAHFGCKQAKGVEMDAKQLIPADAEIAFGFELDPVRKSPLASALSVAMRSDADLSAMMDAVPKCDINVEAMHVFFAGKMDTDDEFVAVVEAPGIGDEDIVKCAENEIRKVTGGKDGILLFSTRGDVRTTPQEGGGYLIILNKNTLVIVGRSWEDAVFAAIESPTVKPESALHKAIAGADTSAHMWGVATIAEADVADLEIPGSAGIRSLAMSLNLATGLGVDVSFGFVDAEKADEFRTAMPAVAEELTPALAEVGLPADLLASLKVAGEGTTVSAKLQIASEALPGLVMTVGAIMAEP